MTSITQTSTESRLSTPTAGAHSFTAALCGFLGSTAATTVVMLLLSSV
ncbi:MULTISPECIES: hypothetical protein [Methylobacterium]|jgi:hypothetical protein|uniref:Uncharacterized protein n=1 Tax=Methylobacterium ajmalii TaxID=2738439 RepID=A0ABU9ZME2_9HYPH|nr:MULTISPECIES: hypothetical protein [Methylobacterium]MBK3395377.1 hypothetical protein [Methylobacterium ajmalii]MBK3426232.1 hypothetical protein [Methylobacterium ajmalii]MBZ6412985.1 hypothetical protein [Methylobacterium sp.]SFE98169.1 hypothetical protein SAMN04487844_108183 [Methylobacterium sp. yr596]